MLQQLLADAVLRRIQPYLSSSLQTERLKLQLWQGKVQLSDFEFKTESLGQLLAPQYAENIKALEDALNSLLIQQGIPCRVGKIYLQDIQVQIPWSAWGGLRFLGFGGSRNPRSTTGAASRTSSSDSSSSSSSSPDLSWGASICGVHIVLIEIDEEELENNIRKRQVPDPDSETFKITEISRKRKMLQQEEHAIARGKDGNESMWSRVFQSLKTRVVSYVVSKFIKAVELLEVDMKNISLEVRGLSESSYCFDLGELCIGLPSSESAHDTEFQSSSPRGGSSTSSADTNLVSHLSKGIRVRGLQVCEMVLSHGEFMRRSHFGPVGLDFVALIESQDPKFLTGNKVTLNIKLERISMSVFVGEVRNLLGFLSRTMCLQLVLQYMENGRPICSSTKFDPKEWWIYGNRCVQRSLRRQSANSNRFDEHAVLQAANDRREYVSLFHKRHLFLYGASKKHWAFSLFGSGWSEKDQRALDALDYRLSLVQLRVFRELARREIQIDQRAWSLYEPTISYWRGEDSDSAMLYKEIVRELEFPEEDIVSPQTTLTPELSTSLANSAFLSECRISLHLQGMEAKIISNSKALVLVTNSVHLSANLQSDRFVAQLELLAVKVHHSNAVPSSSQNILEHSTEILTISSSDQFSAENRLKGDSVIRFRVEGTTREQEARFASPKITDDKARDPPISHLEEYMVSSSSPIPQLSFFLHVAPVSVLVEPLVLLPVLSLAQVWSEHFKVPEALVNSFPSIAIEEPLGSDLDDSSSDLPYVNMRFDGFKVEIPSSSKHSLCLIVADLHASVNAVEQSIDCGIHRLGAFVSQSSNAVSRFLTDQLEPRSILLFPLSVSMEVKNKLTLGNLALSSVELQVSGYLLESVYFVVQSLNQKLEAIDFWSSSETSQKALHVEKSNAEPASLKSMNPFKTRIRLHLKFPRFAFVLEGLDVHGGIELDVGIHDVQVSLTADANEFDAVFSCGRISVFDNVSKLAWLEAENRRWWNGELFSMQQFQNTGRCLQLTAKTDFEGPIDVHLNLGQLCITLEVETLNRIFRCIPAWQVRLARMNDASGLVSPNSALLNPSPTQLSLKQSAAVVTVSTESTRPTDQGAVILGNFAGLFEGLQVSFGEEKEKCLGLSVLGIKVNADISTCSESVNRVELSISSVTISDHTRGTGVHSEVLRIINTKSIDGEERMPAILVRLEQHASQQEHRLVTKVTVARMKLCVMMRFFSRLHRVSQKLQLSNLDPGEPSIHQAARSAGPPLVASRSPPLKLDAVVSLANVLIEIPRSPYSRESLLIRFNEISVAIQSCSISELTRIIDPLKGLVAPNCLGTQIRVDLVGFSGGLRQVHNQTLSIFKDCSFGVEVQSFAMTGRSFTAVCLTMPSLSVIISNIQTGLLLQVIAKNVLYDPTLFATGSAPGNVDWFLSELILKSFSLDLLSVVKGGADVAHHENTAALPLASVSVKEIHVKDIAVSEAKNTPGAVSMFHETTSIRVKVISVRDCRNGIFTPFRTIILTRPVQSPKETPVRFKNVVENKYAINIESKMWGGGEIFHSSMQADLSRLFVSLSAKFAVLLLDFLPKVEQESQVSSSSIDGLDEYGISSLLSPQILDEIPPEPLKTHGNSDIKLSVHLELWYTENPFSRDSYAIICRFPVGLSLRSTDGSKSLVPDLELDLPRLILSFCPPGVLSSGPSGLRSSMSSRSSLRDPAFLSHGGLAPAIRTPDSVTSRASNYSTLSEFSASSSLAMAPIPLLRICELSAVLSEKSTANVNVKEVRFHIAAAESIAIQTMIQQSVKEFTQATASNFGSDGIQSEQGSPGGNSIVSHVAKSDVSQTAAAEPTVLWEVRLEKIYLTLVKRWDEPRSSVLRLISGCSASGEEPLQNVKGEICLRIDILHPRLRTWEPLVESVVFAIALDRKRLQSRKASYAYQTSLSVPTGFNINISTDGLDCLVGLTDSFVLRSVTSSSSRIQETSDTRLLSNVANSEAVHWISNESGVDLTFAWLRRSSVLQLPKPPIIDKQTRERGMALSYRAAGDMTSGQPRMEVSSRKPDDVLNSPDLIAVIIVPPYVSLPLDDDTVRTKAMGSVSAVGTEDSKPTLSQLNDIPDLIRPAANLSVNALVAMKAADLHVWSDSLFEPVSGISLHESKGWSSRTATVIPSPSIFLKLDSAASYYKNTSPTSGLDSNKVCSDVRIFLNSRTIGKTNVLTVKSMLSLHNCTNFVVSMRYLVQHSLEYPVGILAAGDEYTLPLDFMALRECSIQFGLADISGEINEEGLVDAENSVCWNEYFSIELDSLYNLRDKHHKYVLVPFVKPGEKSCTLLCVHMVASDLCGIKVFLSPGLKVVNAMPHPLNVEIGICNALSVLTSFDDAVTAIEVADGQVSYANSIRTPTHFLNWSFNVDDLGIRCKHINSVIWGKPARLARDSQMRACITEEANTELDVMVSVLKSGSLDCMYEVKIWTQFWLVNCVDKALTIHAVFRNTERSSITLRAGRSKNDGATLSGKRILSSDRADRPLDRGNSLNRFQSSSYHITKTRMPYLKPVPVSCSDANPLNMKLKIGSSAWATVRPIYPGEERTNVLEKVMLVDLLELDQHQHGNVESDHFPSKFKDREPRTLSRGAQADVEKAIFGMSSSPQKLVGGRRQRAQSATQSNVCVLMSKAVGVFEDTMIVTISSRVILHNLMPESKLLFKQSNAEKGAAHITKCIGSKQYGEFPLLISGKDGEDPCISFTFGEDYGSWSWSGKIPLFRSKKENRSWFAFGAPQKPTPTEQPAVSAVVCLYPCKVSNEEPRLVNVMLDMTHPLGITRITVSPRDRNMPPVQISNYSLETFVFKQSKGNLGKQGSFHWSHQPRKTTLNPRASAPYTFDEPFAGRSISIFVASRQRLISVGCLSLENVWDGREWVFKVYRKSASSLYNIRVRCYREGSLLSLVVFTGHTALPGRSALLEQFGLSRLALPLPSQNMAGALNSVAAQADGKDSWWFVFNLSRFSLSLIGDCSLISDWKVMRKQEKRQAMARSLSSRHGWKLPTRSSLSRSLSSDEIRSSPPLELLYIEIDKLRLFSAVEATKVSYDFRVGNIQFDNLLSRKAPLLSRSALLLSIREAMKGEGDSELVHQYGVISKNTRGSVEVRSYVSVCPLELNLDTKLVNLLHTMFLRVIQRDQLPGTHVPSTVGSKESKEPSFSQIDRLERRESVLQLPSRADLEVEPSSELSGIGSGFAPDAHSESGSTYLVDKMITAVHGVSLHVDPGEQPIIFDELCVDPIQMLWSLHVTSKDLSFLFPKAHYLPWINIDRAYLNLRAMYMEKLELNLDQFGAALATHYGSQVLAAIYATALSLRVGNLWKSLVDSIPSFSSVALGTGFFDAVDVFLAEVFQFFTFMSVKWNSSHLGGRRKIFGVGYIEDHIMRARNDVNERILEVNNLFGRNESLTLDVLSTYSQDISHGASQQPSLNISRLLSAFAGVARCSLITVGECVRLFFRPRVLQAGRYLVSPEGHLLMLRPPRGFTLDGAFGAYEYKRQGFGKRMFSRVQDMHYPDETFQSWFALSSTSSLMVTSKRVIYFTLNTFSTLHEQDSADIQLQLEYRNVESWELGWECLLQDVIGFHCKQNRLEFIVLPEGGFRWRNRVRGFGNVGVGVSYIAPHQQVSPRNDSVKQVWNRPVPSWSSERKFYASLISFISRYTTFLKSEPLPHAPPAVGTLVAGCTNDRVARDIFQLSVTAIRPLYPQAGAAFFKGSPESSSSPRARLRAMVSPSVASDSMLGSELKSVAFGSNPGVVASEVDLSKTGLAASLSSNDSKPGPGRFAASPVAFDLGE